MSPAGDTDMGGRLLRSILLFSLHVNVLLALDSHHAHTNVVVYIDGFAKWFLNRTNLRLTGFEEVRQNGYEADYVLPEFPSVPATNYWSIFTGRYPNRHGLIGDMFWSATANKLLEFDNADSYDNNLAYLNRSEPIEPIWMTAKRKNVPTSMYYWRPCPDQQMSKKAKESMVNCLAYDGGEDVELIVNKTSDIMHDINSLKKRLVLVGYPSIAASGRKYGAYTGHTTEKIERISTFLQELQNELTAYNRWNDVNLIVISGNGMATVPINNVYFIDDFLEMELVDKLVGNGAYMWIYAHPGMEHKVHQSLDDNTIPHCRLHWRRNFPERWHLKEASDAGELLLLCEQGYAIYSRNRQKQLPRMPVELTEDYFRKGEFGYDNGASDMKGIFMARGPDFPKGQRDKWIRATQIYPQLCRLIQLDCDLPAEHHSFHTRTAVGGSSQRIFSPLLVSAVILLTLCASVDV
uniref:glycerophosphocholine cholinephosphodiesterase n=1 Tax=Plectus sambesii TaxID=2011161 RepID=A0A914V5F3_9BILA